MMHKGFIIQFIIILFLLIHQHKVFNTKPGESGALNYIICALVV